MLFIFAAWCGTGGATRIWPIIQSRLALAAAQLWILFAFLVVMSWHFAILGAWIPEWLSKTIYPIDKTDLDMFRFTHFLALALIVSRYVPHDWAPLKFKWLRPAIMCGRHSLPIFCFGVFLSFAAHWVLMQYTRGVWEQLVVSAAGILVMIAIAWVLDRAAEVPDLFVDVAEIERRKAALEPGKA
jgi:hypothetical protein